MNTVLQTPSTQTASLPGLRRAMRANAIFSGLSGLIALVASRSIAEWTGIPAPAALIGLGVMLIGYEIALFWTTAQSDVAGYGRIAVGLDVVWVLASMVLLLSDWLPLTTAGKWTVGVLAEIVFWFAVWQGYMLWKGK